MAGHGGEAVDAAGKPTKHEPMKGDHSTDGPAAIGLLVLLLPAGMITTAMTGSAVWGSIVCALPLVGVFKLLWNSGGGD